MNEPEEQFRVQVYIRHTLLKYLFWASLNYQTGQFVHNKIFNLEINRNTHISNRNSYLAISTWSSYFSICDSGSLKPLQRAPTLAGFGENSRSVKPSKSPSITSPDTGFVKSTVTTTQNQQLLAVGNYSQNTFSQIEWLPWVNWEKVPWVNWNAHSNGSPWVNWMNPMGKLRKSPIGKLKGCP